MLNRENFNIKSLAYNEYSYANPGNKFYYDYTSSGGTLLYTDFFEIYGTKTAEIKDNNIFSKRIYNIIKEWKRNYESEALLFESLLWDLKIELADSTSYRFRGQHKTPENFNDLVNCLKSYCE